MAVSRTDGERGNVQFHKNLGLVSEVLRKDVVHNMNGDIGIGHVRYSTTGESVAENAQPLVLSYIKGSLALAHNGNLVNTEALKWELIQTGAIFHTTTDSEVIAFHIARERVHSATVEEAVHKTVEKIRGGYALVIMSPRKLIGARDPYGLKPLCLGKRYPASHFVSAQDNLKRTTADIRQELLERLTAFKASGRLVEAQRLEQRTQLDLEMIEELGYCNGIENYSRHLDGRKAGCMGLFPSMRTISMLGYCNGIENYSRPLDGRKAGEPPSCLLNYFPEDFILFVDESHITVPQVGGMFKGDRSRKQTLVDYGFRLPSALDNRPLQFDEFRSLLHQVVYVSATPGKYEMDQSQGIISEQIIRPTGLVDPEVEVRPTKGQMEDLLGECRERIRRGERVLVTTLTKRMAEDLTEYCCNMGVNARYLHSDIDTLERLQIIRALRQGEFDVLVGINLLREGLDIPEVSLVCILDADKEGFLRSTGSLIQTFGRAARNVHGHVILYADTVTASMRAAMDETERRRAKQTAYNTEHGITPRSTRKSLESPLDALYVDTSSSSRGKGRGRASRQDDAVPLTAEDTAALVQRLEKEMREAARELEFERAAALRDRIRALRERLIALPE